MQATTQVNVQEFATMGKEALRAACRTAGISYGKLAGNDGMRAALVAHYTPVEVAPVTETEKTLDEIPSALNPFGALLGTVAPPAFKGNSVKAVDGKIVEPGSTPVVEKKEPSAPRVKRVVTPAPVLPRALTKGLKVQKDREERNGVKRPSLGGVCAAVWAHLDANSAVKAGDLADIADANGWNRANVSCEFYAWRKFMGIKGRQA